MNRPCDRCRNLVEGPPLYGEGLYGPAETGPDLCTEGHRPDDPEECEDYTPGRPTEAREYARQMEWASDERV